ncbi:putative 3-isopropylmalate dehydratase small subunit 3, partial [Cocos nucifera]
SDSIAPSRSITFPSKPVKYCKLGSFALSGLPSTTYPNPFIPPGAVVTGKIYPFESEETGIYKECTAGGIGIVDLAKSGTRSID